MFDRLSDLPLFFKLLELDSLGSLRNLEAANGIKVSAMNNDEISAAHIDRPKSCIQMPNPDFERNTNGTKTHIVVAVAAMIATLTSLLPVIAA